MIRLLQSRTDHSGCKWVGGFGQRIGQCIAAVMRNVDGIEWS
jgi:hypothetical protein